MFTCIFALARTVGWIAQWNEMISDPEHKIGRPRQLYTARPAATWCPWRSAADPRPPPTPTESLPMSSVLQQFASSSALYGANAPFVEALYEAWLADPASVDPGWRAQFESWQSAGNGRDVAHTPVIEAFAQAAKRGPRPVVVAAPAAADDDKQMKVLMFIRAHRTTGSHYSQLDPLRRMDIQPVPELELATYGLTEADLDTEFAMGSFGNRRERATLRDIVARVRKTYCGTIGVEYMYLESMEEKRWLRERFEGTLSTPSLNERQKRFLLERMTACRGARALPAHRYVGQKRFSLEGGES
jgi:2-oxoglutarate dehydrogenase E1 component